MYVKDFRLGKPPCTLDFEIFISKLDIYGKNPINEEIKTMHTVRVRFAPSPTGMMHLGNVRAAFINYLFAQQKQGTFILRIEDTDAQRMFDPHAQKIIEDLQWLGLSYGEGPHVGGPYAPYYQSERT